ncbi:hypothetical protein [Streptomyces sp. NPDC051776]|uniref:hypothetical protein n=1 Tax=Streptomyces sp. NPDC051776 TaxID=3155414 RepID=UPI003428AD51
MTHPADERGTPLPEFTDLDLAHPPAHPVLSAILAGLGERGPDDDVVAYYEDAP